LTTYTIQDAINSAKVILKNTHKINKVCIDVLKNRSLEDSITLEELNIIQDDLVSDTLFYEN
jgi:hypothetical protein